MRLHVIFIVLLHAWQGVSAQEGCCLEDFARGLNDAALELTHQEVIYDPGYYSIAYPNGDVPAGKGVCSDVVVRAYRKMGIDLQKEVHEDMRDHFNVYPGIWGLSKPDPADCLFDYSIIGHYVYTGNQ